MAFHGMESFSFQCLVRGHSHLDAMPSLKICGIHLLYWAPDQIRSGVHLDVDISIQFFTRFKLHPFQKTMAHGCLNLYRTDFPLRQIEDIGLQMKCAKGFFCLSLKTQDPYYEFSLTNGRNLSKECHRCHGQQVAGRQVGPNSGQFNRRIIY